MSKFVFSFILLLLFENTVMSQEIIVPSEPRPWVRQRVLNPGETIPLDTSQQTLTMYLLNKKMADPELLSASVRKPPFNYQSNEYYETALRFNNKMAECSVDLKNKTLDCVQIDIRRKYKSPDIYYDPQLSYPYFYNLIVQTQKKEELDKFGTHGGMETMALPMPFGRELTFHERLCRAANLYRNETYTKTVFLFHQDVWSVLQKATNQELKDDFYLCVPFEFYVKLEDSGLLEAEARPSLTFNRQTIMNLRSLQKRMETQTPGSTTARRLEFGNHRPVGNPLFDASLGFDSKTGMLTLSLSNEADGVDGSGAVRANLDTLFGYKGDDQNFLCGFTVNTSDGETIAVKCDDKICEQSDFRIFDLVDRETISKECKVWELAVWEQLLERATAKRAEKFTISFVVKHELISQVKDAKPDTTTLGTKKDDKTVFDTKKDEKTVSVTIDSRTILRMEQLRKTQETEGDEL